MTDPGSDSEDDCLCRPGYGVNYTLPRTTCSNCVAGKYKVDRANVECSQCAKGKASNATTAAFELTCKECTKGKYASENGSTACSPCATGKYQSERGMSTCEDCDMGKYQPKTNAKLKWECRSCQRATYGNISGLSSCWSCPEGTTSEDSSTSLEQCTCLRGHEGVDGKVCTKCDAGKYKELEGAGVCTECELGRYNPDPQSYDRADCRECGVGKYSNVTGSTQCTACPDGKTTEIDDPSSRHNCTCKAGYKVKYTPFIASQICSDESIRSDAKCTVKFTGLNKGQYMVTLGVYQTDFSSSNEYLTIKGEADGVETVNTTILENDGSDGGDDGHCSTPEEYTYDFEIDDIDGFFEINITASPDVNNAGCRKNLVIGEDVLFVNVTIASNETEHAECEACPAGSSKNLTGRGKCSECTAGTFSKSSATVCQQCQAGTYQDNRGASECMECPGNSTSTPGSADFSKCKCAPGHTQDSEAQMCTPCEMGTWKNSSGSEACIRCSEGKFSAVLAADSITVCKACGENAWSYAGASACTQCDVNAVLNTSRDKFCQCKEGYSGNGTSCHQCFKGQYKDEIGNWDECLDCPEDTYNDNLGSTSVQACTSCPQHSHTGRKGQRSSANANVTKDSNTTEMSAWHAQTGHIRIRKGDGNAPRAKRVSMETTRIHETAASTANHVKAGRTSRKGDRLIATVVLTILNRIWAVLTVPSASVMWDFIVLCTHAKNVRLENTRIQPVIMSAMNVRMII